MKIKILNYIHFRSKLAFSYLILILLPVIVVGVFSYNVALESLKEHTKNNIDLTVEQIKDNIVYKIDSINNISNYIANDINFQKTLLKQYNDYERVEYVTYLKAYTLPLLNLPVTTNHIAIYVNNKDIPEVTNKTSAVDPAATKGFSILNIETCKQQGIYEILESSGDSALWYQIGEDKTYKNISLIKRLYNLENVLLYGPEKSQLGYVRITIKLQDLIDVEQFKKSGNNRYLLMLDDKNEILFSYPECEREKFEDLAESEKFIKINNYVPEIKSNIVVVVPVSDLEASAERVKSFTWFISLLSLVVFTFLGFIISKYFSSKTSELVRFIKSFRDGEFNKRINTNTKDELYQISSAVNDMASAIDNLIEEVYVTNLRKANAELQVLQSQINPHFLYNSLSSISTLAQLGRIDGLNEMTDSLVAFYRLTLNKGSFIITVENELKQVRSYADIKKIQYRERVNIVYDIDPKVYRYKTVKIILQPFVENSFEHGMKKGGKININILAYEETDKIVFKIIDDGIGISPDLICQIFQHDENPLGYGIRNVDDRIKLQYGAEYGVTIFSRVGIGTTVKIVIPATMD